MMPVNVNVFPLEAVARELAKELKLERTLVFLDTETTGTNPRRDRIIEIATTAIRPDGTTKTWETFVNPGLPIPPGATAVHGITDLDVAKALPFTNYARALSRVLLECDVAGYGALRFDLAILAAEIRRCGLPFDHEKVRVVDAMSIFYRKEPRDLSAAALRYTGEKHDGAHRAQVDVAMSMRVMHAQMHEYPDLPRSVASLAEFCEDRDPDALDPDGCFVRRDGIVIVGFGKFEGTPLSKVDKGYLKWMQRQDFGATAMKIVEGVLRGEYPK